MGLKNTPRPRPNKNSDGQDKKPTPTMSHDIHISPGKPPEPPTPPGAPAPGSTNPMTHPNHPGMQSSMGSPMPGTAPAGPTEAPADNRQVQERIQFKDLPPASQSQVQQQQGLDPYAPVKMAQQATQGALAKGPSSGPVPNMMTGPYLPPDVANFPDDMAHLTTLMQQGYAPGASAQEHQFAQNANSMARAKIDAAMSNAQQGAGSPVAQPLAPPPPAAPPGPPMAPPSPMAPPDAAPGPPMAPPGLDSSMAGPPPSQPGAPGGIPPELIAALAEQAKRKQPRR